MGGYCEAHKKHGYSKRDAQTKRNWLAKQGRERLRIYACPSCRMWHLTHIHANNDR